MTLSETCEETSSLEFATLEDLIKLYTVLNDEESVKKLKLLQEKRDE